MSQLGLMSSFNLNIDGLSEAEQAKLDSVSQLVRLDAEKVCVRFQVKNAESNYRSQLESILIAAKEMVSTRVAKINEQKPRAKKLGEAWGKYRDLLLKSIEDQSVPATKVAGQLAWIIAIFCVFGILMFLSVRAFPNDVQIELIASGQVIQFATVMVLLIVVCVLGMSGFLIENTLGILLGGIGGYVLSQGVGRAVSRAANSDSPTNIVLKPAEALISSQL